MKTKILVILALAVLLCTALAVSAQAPTKPAKPPAPAAQAAPAIPPVPTGKTRITGVISNMNGGPFMAGQFAMEIDSWTTSEEAKEWAKVLQTGGQDALLKKVWSAKQIGYLKVGGSLGKPLFAIRAIAIPGGIVIRALTNTPISNVGMRSEDYPFGFLEMIIPADGSKGQGTIVGMAQISIGADGTLQVAAYGNLPGKLQELEIEKPKK